MGNYVDTYLYRMLLLTVVLLIFGLTQIVNAANATNLGDGSFKSQVSWEKGRVEAIGTGLPPANAMTPAQARLLARRAAIVDGYRNLAEIALGVRVDAETTMQNLCVESDWVNTRVSGLIKGAQVIEEMQLPDGTYQVVLAINLYGANGLGGVAYDAKRPAQIKEIPVANMGAEKPKVQITTNVRTVTGVIVDARGLALEPSFYPSVYDDTGNVVYGMQYVDPNYAAQQGVVEYVFTDDAYNAAVNGKSRAGRSPIIVKAVSLRDANYNLVITNADAQQIIASNVKQSYLKSAAVVLAH